MDKGETADQTISFSWKSVSWEKGGLRWAETPDEVPPWDVSRGCPLAEHSILFKYKLDAPAPPQRGYPRLVRADIDEHAVESPSNGENVLSEIATLYEHLPAWREGKAVKKLKSDVLQLAERYGAPYAPEKNSLEAWLVLAAHVHTYLWAYRTFCDEGAEALILEARLRSESMLKREVLVPKSSSHELFEFMRQLDAPWHTEFDDLTTLGAPVGNFYTYRNDGSFRRLEELCPPVSEYRHVIASQKLFPGLGVDGHEFPHGATARLSLETDHMTIHCPVSVWADFKLAEVWRNGAKVSTCRYCHSIFIPSRRNNIYCSRGTCAYKSHKAAQKAKA